MLYRRLDDQRKQASAQLATTLRENGGNPQARVERDASVALYADRIAQLDAAENGLCFGRLDLADGQRRYIGRIGLFDPADEYRPLLMDWRAPAAAAFYVATAAAPDGVRRRRHIRTSRRTVTGIDDEVLDPSAVDRYGAGDPRRGLTGETTLLAALNADRTGRMRDIVTTIQAEQDEIIRADAHGVLVVQGGPGTGKTAVALHRAAYLLYTHRERLTRRGVLLVGPNTTFLRYIDQVLPSLGETGVLAQTVGQLYPGVDARAVEPAEAAELKGRLDMVEVLTAAIRDRQELPDEAVPIRYGNDEVVWLDAATCASARQRARDSGVRHNLARPVFCQAVIDALVRQVAAGFTAEFGIDVLDAGDLAEINRELQDSPELWEVLDGLWPELTPQQLLADLFTSAERLAAAMPDYPDEQRALLLREDGEAWTPADAVLLDEAAELLGEDTSAERAQAEREHAERVAYAQDVLNIMELDAEEVDPDELIATDLLDAEELAARHDDTPPMTAAERAAADRTWTFGHVIVDEAQELSAMAWRVLMRRCPSRSMTLVGDLAQTGDLAGVTSWAQVLHPYVADRWRLRRLTVNYRTPSEVMAVAADVLAAIDPAAEVMPSVRDAGVRPWRLRVDPAELADRLAELVAAELAGLGGGRLAVLVPTSRITELGGSVDQPTDLDSQVVVLGVGQAKGLEFDSVLVVDPARIVAESPRGLSDLYVALTRATQRLGVLHPGELPPVLDRLEPRDYPVGAVRS
ncbi:HelD family protein [Goodfellowiella coeruleoviolacea]|uniref:DNA helicase IV n=1 Tax=Goodfellowiella coeruleoviolacea TaxID=334858 RepID=A0AAE3KIZ1_9PSEU|nr:AAA family ATPase [Goodfellowiella coeruleoviolacea]MCP2169010.1 DNA helicase IV [Goodfellowiella coeruleoviolacea]